MSKGGKDFMEFGKKIKHYRSEKGLSQDNLAERIFVSRQTISNWENDKSYPDINSILLLSEVFEISIDDLIKGDVEKMKIEINTEEVEKINFYSTMMMVFLLLAVVSLVPLAKFIGLYALIPFLGLGACSMFFALKIEKIKKNNDIQTYREIVAFTEGKKLDEIKKIEEKAKGPYQKILLVLAFTVTALVIIVFISSILK